MLSAVESKRDVIKKESKSKKKQFLSLLDVSILLQSPRQRYKYPTLNTSNKLIKEILHSYS